MAAARRGGYQGGADEVDDQLDRDDAGVVGVLDGGRGGCPALGPGGDGEPGADTPGEGASKGGPTTATGALGITWEYEAERYQLPSGKCLPDFWLPRRELFYEVKGVAPTATYRQLFRELSEGTGHRLALVVGSIPDPGRYKPGIEGESDFWIDLYDPSIDTGLVELQGRCRCPRCGFYDVAYDGITRWSACGCREGTEHCGQPTNPLVLEAMRAARSARFEHGRSGAI